MNQEQKEIALRVADDMCITGEPWLEEFASRFLSALPQSEPVGWWNGRETAFFEHETDGPVGECSIPIYTHSPDSAARIAELEKEVERLNSELLKSLSACDRCPHDSENSSLHEKLRVAREALLQCESTLEDCRDYPLTMKEIVEALAQIGDEE